MIASSARNAAPANSPRPRPPALTDDLELGLGQGDLAAHERGDVTARVRDELAEGRVVLARDVRLRAGHGCVAGMRHGASLVPRDYRDQTATSYVGHSAGVGAAAPAEQERREQGGRDRPDQHGGLRGLGLAGRERQVGDQQGHREPDARQHRDPGDVAPRQVVVELGPGEPGDAPRPGEHAEGLAHHEPEEHADHHGVAHQVGTAADHHPGREQGEERHRDAGRQRGEPVLEALGGGVLLVLVGEHAGEQPERHPGDGRVDAALVHAPPGRRRDRHVGERSWSPAGAGEGRTSRAAAPPAAAARGGARRCRTPR